MKVLHINAGQDGGAAWCAKRINNALAQQGIESKMLFASGRSMPIGIKGEIAISDKDFWYSNPILARIKHLLMRCPWYYDQEKVQQMIDKANIKLSKLLYVHTPYSNYTNIAEHPLVEWADIIHLHWVTNFVDYPSFFKKVKKPIVWTLHDNYPAVGIQHFYSAFTPLPEVFNEVDQLCRKIKRDSLKHTKFLYPVAISAQMKTICENSDVIGNFPVTLIHNGVDVDIFKPRQLDKSSVLSRYTESRLFISEQTKTFMFVACEIWDINKGLERILDAMARIQCSDKMLIIVGNNCQQKTVQAPFPTICTGLISDQEELAALYSISDFFISASYEETYGQTTTEALSCGCPVIATPTGVAPELAQSKYVTICQGFTSSDLVEGINRALSNNYNSDEIRQFTIEHFGYEKIANNYISLYTEILKRASN